MKVLHRAAAGTKVSNDIIIEVEPHENGIEIELDSCMENLYGNMIRERIRKTIEEMGVSDVKVKATDFGALDYTIEARVETAIRRSGSK